MATNTRAAVDQIVTDLNNLKPDQDFSKVASEVVALQGADRRHFQANLAEINSKVDMKKLGFGEDFQIVGFRGDQMVARSQDGKNVEFRQLNNMNSVQAVENTGKMQPVGEHGRQMLVRPDGSASYKVEANKGDCYWRVAADVLQSRNNGQAANDNQVANFVNELAAYNHKADPNKVRVGETIEIPPPVVSPKPADAIAPTDNTGATKATTAPTDNTGATTATTAPTDNTGATTATTAPTDNTGATTATTAPTDNTGPVTTTAPTDNTGATTTTAPTDNTGATTTTAPTDNTGATTATAPTDTPPAVPSLAQNSPVLQPSGDKQDIYNPLAPVGQTSTFGEVWNDKPHGLAASRTLEGTDTDSASGSTTNHYKGYLDNSYLFNWTQQGFRADETVDAQGNLTHRKTVYVNDWGTPSLKFQTPDGPQNIDKVNSVESTRDAATGAWKTVIQDVWGKRWQAESAPDGRVTSFKPIDAAPADPVSLEITPWLGM